MSSIRWGRYGKIARWGYLGWKYRDIGDIARIRQVARAQGANAVNALKLDCDERLTDTSRNDECSSLKTYIR